MWLNKGKQHCADTIFLKPKHHHGKHRCSFMVNNLKFCPWLIWTFCITLTILLTYGKCYWVCEEGTVRAYMYKYIVSLSTKFVVYDIYLPLKIFTGHLLYKHLDLNEWASCKSHAMQIACHVTLWSQDNKPLLIDTLSNAE